MVGATRIARCAALHGAHRQRFGRFQWLAGRLRGMSNHARANEVVVGGALPWRRSRQVARRRNKDVEVPDPRSESALWLAGVAVARLRAEVVGGLGFKLEVASAYRFGTTSSSHPLLRIVVRGIRTAKHLPSAVRRRQRRARCLAALSMIQSGSAGSRGAGIRICRSPWGPFRRLLALQRWPRAMKTACGAWSTPTFRSFGGRCATSGFPKRMPRMRRNKFFSSPRANLSHRRGQREGIPFGTAVRIASRARRSRMRRRETTVAQHREWPTQAPAPKT